MVDGKIAALAICLVLTPAIASTNGRMSFNIYLDDTSPYYTVYSGLSAINNVNQEFSCYAYWLDDVELGTFTVEWDRPGYQENTTEQSISNGWSNYSTYFISIDEGKVINYKIHASDYRSNWNSTYERTVTIASIKPENTIIGQDNATPSIGDMVEIYSYWVDNFEIDNVVLQTNETGVWHDNGSQVDIDLVEGWANFTIDTTGMNNSPYHWRLIGEDQIGNSNTTPVQFFTPQ